MRVIAKGSGRKCGDGTSVGLFIPLPLHLARKFPTLIPDDHSPSHVTLLYIGEVTDPDDQKRLVEVLRKICGRWYWKDAKATLGEISSFENGERVVPHMQVEFSRDFASFRRLIKQELAQEGFKPEDKFVEYQPHVTLDYLGPDEEWGGKTPKGSWTFNRIEVWGLPDVVPKIQLGKSRTAGYRPTEGMSSYQELTFRLQRIKQAVARLEKVSTVPHEINHYMPFGADFIWNHLDILLKDLKRLTDPAAARQVLLIRTVLSQIKADMVLRAKVFKDLKAQQDREYYSETEANLGRLDFLFSEIGELMVHETSPHRSIIQRMRNTLK